MPSFGKRTPFTENHLTPFEQVYFAGGNTAPDLTNRKEGEYSFDARDIDVDTDVIEENKDVNDELAHSRWRCFSRDWIISTKGDSLDISWLKDKDSVDAASLPEPDVLAREAKNELEAAVSELEGLLKALEGVE